ncbi:MAG: serine acetyltransferase [Candidatus Scalindua sp. AMX11]|nr:MAG: serine acetyltransferase [Candidatus Scalindua sp.]NOG84591.1 serine acetyltransferase [Planctomycetota bacterium]RZV92365.1 MAG: serine acetyltransferase [Candidatus Scalindua sp. SCAELEC01]TDE66110.1 MAG: serine acetyltransferase [Candidatus Scalindua sp. AMX11]GJQ59083.1 MAG: serine acetyltransferase [Candidatus Scalindua sp.]
MENTIDSKKNELRLNQITETILDSYERLGGINHLEGPNLPSKKEVSRLVKSLSTIMFPGFYEEATINKNHPEGYLLAQCSTVLECLTNLLQKSLRHECKDGVTCLRSEGDCWDDAVEIGFRLMENIPMIREVVHQDIKAAFKGDPAASSYFEIVLSYPSVQAILVHRLAHFLEMQKVPFIPRMMSEYLHEKTGIDIHPGAKIGNGFFIDHGTGVVIGSTSIIGNNVKLYQHVTLGALSLTDVDRLRNEQKKRHPTVEDNVTIYAGATILGGKTVIGSGSVIGGNVWLTRSVPPDTTVTFDSPYLIFKQKDKVEKHVIDYQI